MDVCEREPLPGQVVNSRTEGAQQLGVVVPLPAGNAFSFFFSTPADAQPPVAEIRGALLDPSGAPLRVCDAPSRDFTFVSARRLHRLAAAPPSTPGANGVLVWIESASPGGAMTLKGLFFTETGCLTTDPRPFDIATAPAGSTLTHVSVVGTSRERFVVAWGLVEGFDGALRARVFKYTATGPSWLGTGLNANGDTVPLVDRVATLSLAMMADGEERFALAWQQVTGGGAAIRFARFDDRFSTLTPAITIDERSSEVRTVEEPRLAIGGTPETTLLTYNFRDSQGLTRGFGVFLDEAGRPRSSSRGAQPFRLTSRATTLESVEAVVQLPTGGFLTSWQERGESADAPTRARALLFDAERRVAFANRACDATDFELSAAGGSHERPQLARLTDGNVLAAWSDDSQQAPDVSGYAIRATVFTPRALLPLR